MTDMVLDLFGSLPRFEGSPLCEEPGATQEERAELAELFFPISEADTERIAAAKALCGRCPVRQECLEHALHNGEDYGIWGGLTEGERREVAVLDRRGQDLPGEAGGSGEVAA